MIESIPNTQPIIQKVPQPEKALIDLRQIKAILYLALRGEVALPVEERKVDIFA